MKNYFERRRIRKTVARISALKKECATKHIYDVRMPLERISTSLANSLNHYTGRKYKMVNECLDKISNNLTNDHATMHRNECLKITNIISDTYIAPSKGEQLILENEEKVNELERSLRLVDKRMNEVNKQMDAALGNDKTTWKRLNKEKNLLIGQARAINQAFDSMIVHTNNLKIAETVKEIRNKYSNLIANQQPLVDIEEFNDICDMNEFVHEESKHQDQSMSEKLFNSCGGDDSDELYYRSLEEKLSKEKSLEMNKEESSLVSSELKTKQVGYSG